MPPTAQDYLQANEGYIANVAAQAEPLRQAWAAWNPQRAAQRALAARITAGELSVEEARAAYTHHYARRPADAAVGDAEAGSVAHPAPFQWPAPRGREVRPALRDPRGLMLRVIPVRAYGQHSTLFRSRIPNSSGATVESTEAVYLHRERRLRWLRCHHGPLTCAGLTTKGSDQKHATVRP